MRLKILTALLSLLLCISSFGQTKKSRTEFFKEFYGTYLNSTDIEVVTKDVQAIPAVDLSDVIKQLEARYNIDIPAEEEAKFTTVEEVAEYVNLYLQNQTKDTDHEAETVIEKPVVKKSVPAKSWKVKLYGSYGLTEPLGVTGNLGWNGNLGGFGAYDLTHNMYTYEVGLLLHPYGWNGNVKKRPNSFGMAFDYSSFDFVGTPDTNMSVYNPNDTTATRYAVSLIFQQTLIGRGKDRPKFSFYIEESLRLGVHSYGFITSTLNDINHLSYGVGLAEGINFLIFDLKFYQNAAYSSDIMRVSGLSLIRSIDLEVGLRLGIALKL